MVLLSKSTQILFLFQLRCQITKIEVNNAPKYCGFYNYHGANKECNICFWTHRLNEAQSANISSNGWTTYAGIREGSQSDYWGDLVESRIRLISAEAEALLVLAELGKTRCSAEPITLTWEKFTLFNNHLLFPPISISISPPNLKLTYPTDNKYHLPIYTILPYSNPPIIMQI